jgi:hypothetical protein
MVTETALAEKYAKLAASDLMRWSGLVFIKSNMPLLWHWLWA